MVSACRDAVGVDRWAYDIVVLQSRYVIDGPRGCRRTRATRKSLTYNWKKSCSARDISHEVDKRLALLESFTLIALLYWMVEADS